MALSLVHSTPRQIEIGVLATLTAEVRDQANAVPSITSATYTLRDGAEILVDHVAATSLGSPLTYSLAASVTSSRSPSETIMEEWAVTAGGFLSTLRRRGFLVRCAFRPTLSDDDLLNRHRQLADFLDPSETSFERYREDAREKIERDLIKRGRRPWLVFDSFALYDAHLALTLGLIFRDARSAAGNGEARELSIEYMAEYEREMGTPTPAKFAEDTNNTGVLEDTTARTAVPVIFAGAGPGNRNASALSYARRL